MLYRVIYDFPIPFDCTNSSNPLFSSLYVNFCLKTIPPLFFYPFLA